MLTFSLFKNRKLKKLVYWWDPIDGSYNAGDHLGRVIVEQMLTLKDKEILDKKNKNNKLLSIGSVMHFANNGDTIWGTGINGKIDGKLHRFTTLDVRSVRGPLTRDFLIQKGIDVPEIYGDPGLLLPLFFSKDLLRKEEQTKKFLVIPHMNEGLDKYKEYSDFLCTPRQGAISFTRQIVNSDMVISSSLHGIIIAEAYGIPAILLANQSGEAKFKFDDYYFGTGRKKYPIASSVTEAFNIEPAEKLAIDEIIDRLFKSFPFDLWE
ncbi:polysaccharide pyruvyl transferase family protein [Sodalis ligni]|uniref:Pyruvyl transferase n=1 Tax=Sodalis ligni TaxID=2697027 RepID=A0A4R1NHW3_9GAMM|nr:polysaccharide pyruvyl transferase family protein [Sodalis ligni]TCL07344.1 pyruvyl transferase [Sodalis ligni]